MGVHKRIVTTWKMWYLSTNRRLTLIKAPYLIKEGKGLGKQSHTVYFGWYGGKETKSDSKCNPWYLELEDITVYFLWWKLFECSLYFIGWLGGWRFWMTCLHFLYIGVSIYIFLIFSPIESSINALFLVCSFPETSSFFLLPMYYSSINLWYLYLRVMDHTSINTKLTIVVKSVGYHF